MSELYLQNQIAGNLARVHERIAAAAARAGRDPGEVTLVAVTKTHPPETVRAAAGAGVLDAGENRIEEAEFKMTAAPQLRWHMIGHVQTRKALEVARAGFYLVHSVDTLKLAQRLEQRSAALGRVQSVLLECNVSGEASKEGFAAADPAAWEALLPAWTEVCALPHVQVRGLMTMAPIVPDPEQARPYFARLRALQAFARARLRGAATWDILSMGMTDDFEAAIAEGATLVRIGRAIFGARA